VFLSVVESPVEQLEALWLSGKYFSDMLCLKYEAGARKSLVCLVVYSSIVKIASLVE
jgi:hypothetical protein